MRYVLYCLMALCAIVVAGGLGYGYYRTLLSESSPKHETFGKGTGPFPMPDGLLKGSVEGLQSSWKGKKLNAKNHTGINIFVEETGEAERYPFKTYQATGLRDPELDVLRIEYDLPGNPFWLRRITDEIVQVQAGTYLGKVHIRLVPGYPFTMGYFRLEQEKHAPQQAGRLLRATREHNLADGAAVDAHPQTPHVQRALVTLPDLAAAAPDIQFNGSAPNGTYLSFLGWPYLRASFLAIARGLVSSG